MARPFSQELLFKIPQAGAGLEPVDGWYRSRGYGLIAGVDEAGRGALAGPVSASAVILGDCEISGLADSKVLTPEVRERLSDEIWRKAVAVGVAMVSQEEIDRSNILKAALEAMRLAVASLTVRPELVLVDGNQLPRLETDCVALVKGDSRSQSIMAASIVAKVTRDRYMRLAAKEYPLWGFERHKGYACRSHIEALQKHGLALIHRRTFNPCKQMIGKLHDGAGEVTIIDCRPEGDPQ
jgi:ribonuclease HII